MGVVERRGWELREEDRSGEKGWNWNNQGMMMSMVRWEWKRRDAHGWGRQGSQWTDRGGNREEMGVERRGESRTTGMDTVVRMSLERWKKGVERDGHGRQGFQ